MPLRVEPMLERARGALAGGRVFLSASIPDPGRWSGPFDALAITDAVVAAARAVLTSAGGLVTAAHPTIAPLMLYVAREFPDIREVEPPIVVYQSRLFGDVLPPATYELAEGGLAELRWTEAFPGDEPEPGKWERSLLTLRETMLRDADPIAAIFVGGMEGIRQEFDIFRQLHERRPAYAVGRPGGEAASLVSLGPPSLAEDLATSESYPALLRRVIDDIASTR
jgi:hypothetical protein